MHDMAREEKNKREVLLLLARLGGTRRMLAGAGPGSLFTSSEEARHAEMPAGSTAAATTDN